MSRIFQTTKLRAGRSLVLGAGSVVGTGTKLGSGILVPNRSIITGVGERQVNALSAGVSAQRSGVNGTATRTPASGGYTPFFTWSAHGRTNGQAIAGNGWSSAYNGATYSTAVAGPFGDATSGRFPTLQSSTGFGGTIVTGSQVTSAAIGAGSHLWFRMYHYFPVGFCHSYRLVDPAGDGWGRTKWFRFDWPSERRTYTDMMASYQTCRSGTSFETGGTEGISPVYFDMDNPPANYLFNGVWVAVQVHIFFSATAGWAEKWLGTTYIGRQVFNSNSTGLPVLTWANAPSSGVLQELVLGDYWNGTPVVDQSFYLDDCIATTQTPHTLDSGGRPYISPSTRARDFA